MGSRTDLRGAASAGLLSGIVGAWQRSATPGALNDLVISPYEYHRDHTVVSLVFADGGCFTLVCVCARPDGLGAETDNTEGDGT